MQRRIIKLLQSIVAVAIFAVLCWKGIALVNQPEDALTLAVIVITALGVTYSASGALFRAIAETIGGIMVLADFLTQRFLDPLKERQREQGLAEGLEQGLEQRREQGLEQGREQGLQQGRKQGLKQGRQAERDDIRARLLEQGFDLDELLPPETDDGRDC